MRKMRQEKVTICVLCGVEGQPYDARHYECPLCGRSWVYEPGV